ncbi:MAG: respiratory nitrate reductase subunit gamma [Gammaproteobacteria bacterium]|nr:respiratory nitrate reductase subunit gamma [Gammaproteobacteria bacterium]
MTSAEFLMFARGPMIQVAGFVFALGLLVRLVEILMLGRSENLAEKRGSGFQGGLRTIISRFFPADQNTFKRSAVTVVAGYVFHVGLFFIIFFLTPHIALFKHLVGFSWPALSTPIIDFLTVLALIAMVVLLWRRLTHPLLKFLSTGEDFIAWTVTFLPLLTGYMSYHHLLLPYNWLLGFHIASVALFLVVFPFTKLMHTFTFFLARWYIGSMAGEKGVRQ